ncbi:LOW QUALITY PROTEIN: hypothetical protein JCM18905_3549 [Vibrio sp. JCM 18905]|nr:LOW QUALITY PROTEIN: hypothetical protein JCM18905_3549 [Vibrio sp. JCM 18905]
MTLSFLKTKDVPIDDLNVTITQLSGLERLDFMDYCSEIPEPDRPAKPEETASETEQENYLIELNKYTQKCSALTFLFQARLVAYGYREGVQDIDERHNQIMSMMTPAQVETLHHAIASFSGLPVPEPEQDETTTEGSDTSTTSTEDTTTQEPVDPKV